MSQQVLKVLSASANAGHSALHRALAVTTVFNLVERRTFSSKVRYRRSAESLTGRSSATESLF